MTSTVFNPSSPQALAISNLFILVLVVMAAIFALITGLAIYASIRYRGRPGEDEPPQIYGHRNLELAWTAGPLLIVAVLFGFTLTTMRTSDPAASAESQQPDLVIVAHQWWWELRYPVLGVISANEIHIATGKALRVRLEAADVIHDFWVPQLARKLDATPGFPTHLWLEADAPGTYLGACSEYCGTQHAWMRLRVVAHPPAEFEAWQQQQLRTPTAPSTGEAALGAQLFQQLTCRNCHAIAGTGADARVGPDLTHLGSRATLGAGVLENTPANLARWLKDPQAVKPGSYMPNLQLTDQDVRALVAYLEALK